MASATKPVLGFGHASVTTDLMETQHCTIGACSHVGIAKDTNEDIVVLHKGTLAASGQEAAILLVIDGHGGRSCAEAVQAMLPAAVFAELNKRCVTPGALSEIQYETVLLSAMENCELHLRSMLMVECGAVVAMVLLHCGKTVVCTLGDSRVGWMTTDGNFGSSVDSNFEVPFSSKSGPDGVPDKDKHPESYRAYMSDEAEVKLMNDSGGPVDAPLYVRCARTTTRQISVAAALGDFEFKGAFHLPSGEQPITSVPKVVFPSGRLRTMVIACDGVWALDKNKKVDKLMKTSVGVLVTTTVCASGPKPSTACEFMCRFISQYAEIVGATAADMQMAAAAIVETAAVSGIKDNLSAIAVHFT